MTVDQSGATVRRGPRFRIKAASADDITAALRAGVTDLVQRPLLSLFFGIVYAIVGDALIAGLFVYEHIWLVIAAGVGFPLVAPFLAAGLYDMSRRLSKSEPFKAMDVLLVVVRQQRREFGWMAFVVLFIFWMWAYQVRILLAIILQDHTMLTVDDVVSVVFTTADGWTFLAVGTVIGAVLSTILFSVTVISMPLLIDKDVDFITAMITSIQTVRESPVVMLGWGALAGALTLLAIAPAFLGVIVIFPLLGHASWHLYGRLIEEN